jgi:serine/threonine-protein kinase
MIQRLGKYRIIERIGRGGMGMVYKAHDPMLDRTVALKVISADGDVTDELRTRFFREAQACARLNHPNVITVYDMGDEDGSLYIVMEFLEGEELRQLIAQRRNVPLEDKLAMMIEVCDGLDYAHKRGIVHRDIKPGNIYVMRDGHVKLLDFGIARISSAADGLTRTNVVMGTLRYMSPEQARGRVDHRSDIFSVGAVFYELLVYRHAFVGEQPMEILDRLRSEDPTPLVEVDPSIPTDLSDIVARSLQKDPGERFPELIHMRVELERVRRRLVEEGDQARARVRARLDEIRVLQRGLTEAVGRSFDDETVPLIDERMRVSGLLALERQCASKIEHLRHFAGRAEALRPALDNACVDGRLNCCGATNCGQEWFIRSRKWAS